MKAIVKTRPEPGYVELKEVPVPKIRPDEILVKIRATGICGTDLLLYDWTYRGRRPVMAPITLGHEGAGEVVEVGDQVKDLKVGDRVGLEALLGCGHCYYCGQGYYHLCPDWAHLGISFDGTFAEYVAYPARGAHKLPDEVSYEEAAFLEPISIVAHAMEKVSVSIGDTVAVVGPGPLGLYALQAARAAGAGKVIVLGAKGDESRLEVAGSLGADAVIGFDSGDAVAATRDLTDGLGPDVVFEASGKPEGVAAAVAMARGMGQVALMGFANEAVIDPLSVVRRDLTICGAVGSIPRHFNRAIRWLRSGKVSTGAMISHRLAWDDFAEGFRLMKERRAAKVLFQ